MAVQLVLANSVVTLSWAMDGANEGLAIELSGRDAPNAGPSGDMVAVGERMEWVGLLGRSIVSVTPAWHVPNEGCSDMPWAFRMDFSNGSSVVIALGESEGSEITYMPDSLVAIFDEDVADAYRIPASSTSSYGN
ncbi:hypothetical protein AC230_10475 [Streptomyces caatingaensis]|uniref:Uncharacterized protein n=2 Tax=Streptomyces caatingaensis TaxID=1678637 RepID=A0A0K9XKB9_9ACTN|nr:hypothetical protein AC230_10475 [Streptomyces caatingaensis]